jgi:hypothetical protein
MPGFTLNGLKREELIALNSVILHELYCASLGGDGRDPGSFAEILDDRPRHASASLRALGMNRYRIGNQVEELIEASPEALKLRFV